MPSPRKIDLMPERLRRKLGEALEARGFGGIVEVTEELNFWLEEAGEELTIGKSAVGEYAKLLKDQRKAFSLAEHLLDDLDVEREGAMHAALMQMIAAQAVQFMRAASDEDAVLDPKALQSLSRMLSNLMQSSGAREKLLAGERERLAAEAREAAAQAASEAAAEAMGEDAATDPAALLDRIRRTMGVV